MIDPPDLAGFRVMLQSWIETEQHGMREPRTFARWFAQRDMSALWKVVREAA